MLLLFDIDGTLLHPGLGHPAMHRAGARVFGPGFALDGVALAGRIDRQIWRDLAARNGVADPPASWPGFRAAYLEELTIEAQTGSRALPGVPELLALLRVREGVTLGLLTGNLADAAPIKLRGAGLDPGWFEVGAFGDEADAREDLVPLARERDGRGLSSEAVWVIGDTPHDVACAKAHDCVAIGVATGRFDRAALEESGADLVLDDLRDPAPLLARLE